MVCQSSRCGRARAPSSSSGPCAQVTQIFPTLVFTRKTHICASGTQTKHATKLPRSSKAPLRAAEEPGARTDCVHLPDAGQTVGFVLLYTLAFVSALGEGFW